MSSHPALLATDLVDSTRLAEQLGDAAISAVWDSHDRLARDLLRAWDGREINKSDGFLLLFASPAAAVNYALAYHKALAKLSIPLLARAAVHVGAVFLRENRREDIELGANPKEIDGIAVPIVVRTMSLAIGGQTLLTPEARAALDGATLSIRSHGHWRMKGLEEPVELFEAGDDDAPFTPPPDSAKVYRVVREGDLWLPLAQVPHSLPAERDRFIGRKESLQALERQLDAGARLVCVVGIGGTGKTRFVQRFGWTWMGDFSGGVWFCDLSRARSLDGIVHAVAQGLNVPLGRTDPVTQLGSALAGRGRCLIILDNFEQVSAFAEQTLGRWLDRAPEARFVVTSRELLGIPGEERFELPPLPSTEATSLFVERAVATKHDFQVTPDDRIAIDRLVSLLDGLPLAIELAAARVRILPPRLLLDRMSERLKVLASTKGRSKRQATLRSTFDWSWDLLRVSDKMALGQLSVFEGGFTLAAAEELLDLSACDDAPPAMDVMQSLVDKSLVRQIGDHRFGLLGTVKEYAADRLHNDTSFLGSGPSATTAAQARHWRYFAALDESSAVADGCVEIDNLIVACRRSVEAGDALAAVGALSGAWAALSLCGPFRSGVDLATMVEGMSGLSKSEIARVDWIAGTALYQLGRVTESHTRFRTGLASSRAAGDRRSEALLLSAIGEQLTAEGNFDAARENLASALRFARELNERALECAALNRLGVMHYNNSRLEDARSHFEAALVIARKLKDRRAEGGLVGNLGGLCHNLGELDRARGYYEKSLLLAREVGDRKWEGNARSNLGLLHHDQGRPDDARLQFEAALQMARDMGHTRLECTVLCNLGIVVEAQGHFEDARGHYERAVVVAHELADRRSEGQFRGYLGMLYARLGRFDDARECLSAGESLLEEVSDTLSLGLLLCSRAGVELMAGDSAAAKVTLRRAEELARESQTGPESELGRALQQLRASLSMPEGR